MQRVVDNAVGVAKESVKTITREGFNYSINFVNGLAAIVVTLVPGKARLTEALQNFELRPTFRSPQLPRWMEDGASSLNKFIYDFAAESEPNSDDDDFYDESGAESDYLTDDCSSIPSSPLSSRSHRSTASAGSGSSAAAAGVAAAGGRGSSQGGGGGGGGSSTGGHYGRRGGGGGLLYWFRRVLLMFLWPITMWFRKKRLPHHRRQSSPPTGVSFSPPPPLTRGGGGGAGGGLLASSRSESSSSLSRQLSVASTELSRKWTDVVEYVTHLNDNTRRGVIEDTQLMMELGIEKIFEGVRWVLLYIVSPWECVRAIYRAVYRALWTNTRAGGGLQGGVPAGAATASAPAGTGAPEVTPVATTQLGATSATVQQQRALRLQHTLATDARTCEDIVNDAGYPYEAMKMTTDDGYVLKLERIPRPGSKRVVLLQHGIADSSLGWVSNGVVGSQAFAAYDQGFDVFLGNLRGYATREHVEPRIPARRYWRYSVNEHGMCDIAAMVEKIHSLKMAELGKAPAWANESRTSGAQGGDNACSPGGGERGPGVVLGELEQAHMTLTAGGRCNSAGMGGDGSVPSGRQGKDGERDANDHASGAGSQSATGGDRQPEGPGEGQGQGQRQRQEDGKGQGQGQGQEERQGQGQVEEEEEQPYSLQCVSHSLGGAAVMVYVVTQRLRQKPHRFSRLILLSPAGFHKHTPFLFDVMLAAVPWIDAFMTRYMPGLYIPTRGLRLLFNKLAQDFQNFPAVRALVQVTMSSLLVGGDTSDWVGALRMPHYNMYNMPGIAYRVAKHLSQMKAADRFQLYDFGSARANRQVYGSAAPLDIGAHYGLVDVPVDVVIGRRDRLIPPAMVMRHYQTLRAAGCRQVSAKEFEYAHLDFTFAHKQDLLAYVMSRLRIPTARELRETAEARERGGGLPSLSLAVRTSSGSDLRGALKKRTPNAEKREREQSGQAGTRGDRKGGRGGKEEEEEGGWGGEGAAASREQGLLHRRSGSLPSGMHALAGPPGGEPQTAAAALGSVGSFRGPKPERGAGGDGDGEFLGGSASNGQRKERAGGENERPSLLVQGGSWGAANGAEGNGEVHGGGHVRAPPRAALHQAGTSGRGPEVQLKRRVAPNPANGSASPPMDTSLPISSDRDVRESPAQMGVHSHTARARTRSKPPPPLSPSTPLPRQGPAAAPPPPSSPLPPSPSTPPTLPPPRLGSSSQEARLLREDTRQLRSDPRARYLQDSLELAASAGALEGVVAAASASPAAAEAASLLSASPAAATPGAAANGAAGEGAGEGAGAGAGTAAGGRTSGGARANGHGTGKRPGRKVAVGNGIERHKGTGSVACSESARRAGAGAGAGPGTLQQQQQQEHQQQQQMATAGELAQYAEAESLRRQSSGSSPPNFANLSDLE